MAKFIPIINCGLHAGETPMHWNCNPVLFYSEEDCDEWINENMDEFAPSEDPGGIYPQEMTEEEFHNFCVARGILL